MASMASIIGPGKSSYWHQQNASRYYDADRRRLLILSILQGLQTVGNIATNISGELRAARSEDRSIERQDWASAAAARAETGHDWDKWRMEIAEESELRSKTRFNQEQAEIKKRKQDATAGAEYLDWYLDNQLGFSSLEDFSKKEQAWLNRNKGYEMLPTVQAHRQRFQAGQKEYWSPENIARRQGAQPDIDTAKAEETPTDAVKNIRFLVENLMANDDTLTKEKAVRQVLTMRSVRGGHNKWAVDAIDTPEDAAMKAGVFASALKDEGLLSHDQMLTMATMALMSNKAFTRDDLTVRKLGQLFKSDPDKYAYLGILISPDGKEVDIPAFDAATRVVISEDVLKSKMTPVHLIRGMPGTKTIAGSKKALAQVVEDQVRIAPTTIAGLSGLTPEQEEGISGLAQLLMNVSPQAAKAVSRMREQFSNEALGITSEEAQEYNFSRAVGRTGWEMRFVPAQASTKGYIDLVAGVPQGRPLIDPAHWEVEDRRFELNQRPQMLEYWRQGIRNNLNKEQTLRWLEEELERLARQRAEALSTQGVQR